MGQRFVEPKVAATASVENRMREDQLTSPGADIELDHVDADAERGVKRVERVGGSQRTGSAVPDPLTAIGIHAAPPG